MEALIVQVEKKKYERAVPRGKHKLVAVNVHGAMIDDVLTALQAFSRRDGHVRTYVDRDGQLIVAADDWQV